jgi:hypothetical protein
VESKSFHFTVSPQKTGFYMLINNATDKAINILITANIYKQNQSFVTFRKSGIWTAELCRHRRMLIHISNTWQLYAITVIVGLHCIFIYYLIIFNYSVLFTHKYILPVCKSTDVSKFIRRYNLVSFLLHIALH